MRKAVAKIRLFPLTSLAAILWLTLGGGGLFAAETKVKRKSALSWEEIEGAAQYEMEIENLDDKSLSPGTFKMTENKWDEELPPGKYRMRLRALDQRQVPGEWSDWSEFEIVYPPVKPQKPIPNEKIKTDQAEKAKVKFEWEALCDACQYQLEIKDLAGQIVATATADKNETETELPVGQKYQWQVVAKGANGTVGERAENTLTFEFWGKQLDKPRLKTPYTDAGMKVEWTAPPHTVDYTVSVSVKRVGSKKWENLVKAKKQQTGELQVDEEWPSGLYRLRVTGHAPLRPKSKPWVYQFKRKNPEEELKKAEQKKPPPGYVLIGYAPKLQRYEIAKDDIKVNFNILYLNSEVLDGAYWFGATRSFGLGLRAQVATAELTASGDSEAGEGREPIPLNMSSFALRVAYRMSWPGLWIEVGTGPLQRDAYYFTADVETNSYVAPKSSLSDWMGEINGTIFLSPSYRLTGFLRSSLPIAASSTLLKVQAYLDSRVALEQQVGKSALFLSYFYLYEYASYISQQQAEDETPYEIASRFYGLGIGLGLRF